MAFPKAILKVLLFVLALSRVDLSKCQVIKAKVSCLDCKTNSDLAGIQVVVKCDKVKKLVPSTTEVDGSFEAQINNPSAKEALNNHNCLAKLLGGPTQLYASRQSMVSQIIALKTPLSIGSNFTHTTSNTLSFYSSCPSKSIGLAKCESFQNLGSSKTIDLPLPREWGLAPSSLYFPFFPIIGIP